MAMLEFSFLPKEKITTFLLSNFKAKLVLYHQILYQKRADKEKIYSIRKPFTAYKERLYNLTNSIDFIYFYTIIEYTK